jgi:hypothetical protein
VVYTAPHSVICPATTPQVQHYALFSATCTFSVLLEAADSMLIAERSSAVCNVMPAICMAMLRHQRSYSRVLQVYTVSSG